MSSRSTRERHRYDQSDDGRGRRRSAEDGEFNTRGQGPPKIEGMISLKVDNITQRTGVNLLKKVFGRFGELGDIYVPRYPDTFASRGFAFVRYYRKRDAEEAMHKMHGEMLDGRVLSIQMARYARPSPSKMIGSDRDGSSTSHRNGTSRYKSYQSRSFRYGGSSRRSPRPRSHSRERSKHTSKRHRSRSSSRHKESRKHKRSRSKDRNEKGKSRSRSHSRSASPNRSRSGSESRSESRSRSRSLRREVERSRDIKKHKSRSRSHSRNSSSRSPSKERRKSRSRSVSRERMKKSKRRSSSEGSESESKPAAKFSNLKGDDDLPEDADIK